MIALVGLSGAAACYRLPAGPETLGILAGEAPVSLEPWQGTNTEQAHLLDYMVGDAGWGG